MPVRMREGDTITYRVGGEIHRGDIIDPALETDSNSGAVTKVQVETPDGAEVDVLVADVVDESAPAPQPPPAQQQAMEMQVGDADVERMMAMLEGGVAPMDMDEDAANRANEGWDNGQQEMAARDEAIAAAKAQDDAPDVTDQEVVQAIISSGSLQHNFNELQESEKQRWRDEMQAFREAYGFSEDPKTILLLTEGVEGGKKERELFMWQMRATKHLLRQVPEGTPWKSIKASLFLLHDVGLGKTITSILSFAAVYKQNPDPAKNKTVIIVPKSMLEIWYREISKWTVLGKDKILMADKQGDFVVNRDPNNNQPLNYALVEAKIRHLGMAHVILTTPHVLEAAFKKFMIVIPDTDSLPLSQRIRRNVKVDVHPLFNQVMLCNGSADVPVGANPKAPPILAMTIIDEMHQVSNPDTWPGVVTRWFARRSKFKLGLSGTAVTSKATQLADLAFLVDAQPVELQDPKTYEDPETGGMRRNGVMLFHKLLADRVLKSYAGKLKKKRLVKFNFDPFVGLRPDGTVNQEAIEMHTRTLEKGWWKSEDPATRAPAPAQDDGLPNTYMDITARLMMYEFSSLLGMHGAQAFDPTVTGNAVDAYKLIEKATREEPSQAMELVARIIKDRQAAGHSRIVVYCHYLAVHRLLERYLEDRDVGGMFRFKSEYDSKERTDVIVDFKACEKGVLFLSAAGGTGITLSPGCEVMVSVGPLPWNATEMDQANGRVHRIGQDKDVEIIQLAAHRSVTESKLKYHDDKRERLGKAAMDADFTNFREDDQWREWGNLITPVARLDEWGNYKVPPAQVDALRDFQEKLALSEPEKPTPPADWPERPVLASRVRLPPVSFPLVVADADA